MLLAELHASSELDSSVVDGIRICCEEMIPAIFGTKKQPWMPDDVVFTEAALYGEDDPLPRESDSTPEIHLVITTYASGRLYKERKRRTREMIAALQEVLSKDGYTINVSLNLIVNATTQSSESTKIPDIVQDVVLADALEVVQNRICFDDEILTDPATRQSMLTVGDVLVGDQQLVSTT